jgi:hypothetical protein
MISFKDFLAERAIVSAYNISRSSMPQIKDHEKFCKHMDDCGQKYEVTRTRTSRVKPVQMEVDQEKIDAMVTSNNLDDKPIIVSKENYIIDGHHRYFAYKQMKRGYVSVIRTNMDLNRSLTFADEYATNQPTEPTGSE